MLITPAQGQDLWFQQPHYQQPQVNVYNENRINIDLGRLRHFDWRHFNFNHAYNLCGPKD